jgi:CysZ protein
MPHAAARPARTRGTGAIRRYLRGAGLLGRGLALYSRRPRLLLLGLIPVILAGVVFVGLLVLLAFFIDDIAAALTWFADDWPDTSRTLVRAIAGVTVLGGALFIGVVSFTSLALLIGDPFYERISRQVEDWHGGAPAEVEIGHWRGFRHSLVDSARLFLVMAPVAVCLFLLGLVPVVGQTVVPVLAATVGGWFLALELTGIPFTRRGLRLADRRRALRAHRVETLGFGTAVFVCFALIPLGAVLLMPAAVAGGTLLARNVLGRPHLPADLGRTNVV